MSSEIATLGGGCFWCLEAVFEKVKGVSRVVSGYTGGHVPNPTYEAVCEKTTGHAEVVQITFDPTAVSYQQLLEVFFAIHDPTTLNRQGADVGPQYRSAIYLHTDAQKQTAAEVIAALNMSVFGGKIVTELTPLDVFYPAEDYHQGFYRNNPMQGYCMAVVSPKVAKFRKQFAGLLGG
ncbi:MAG: peptide-methionine (S)-S-oxide reductase MsrA [Fimbriiglobus sp.]|jgi:peptide-methionine (S)-S-oxide reductase|nr:peptide-methionine (S)-S-oxide reductase MsrA [Fimbriiglobus sp.]